MDYQWIINGLSMGYQWIGLRDNLQEKPHISMGKSSWFPPKILPTKTNPWSYGKRPLNDGYMGMVNRYPLVN